jgi:dephospho-CoA kinase
MFFSSKKVKNKVEKFIFSQIPEVFINEVKSLKSPPVIFYDVPLLFEKNLQDQVDLTVCIFTPPECQRKRLIERDKIEGDLADKIIKSQMDINQKTDLATFSIDNSKSKSEFKKNLDQFLTKTFNFP